MGLGGAGGQLDSREVDVGGVVGSLWSAVMCNA